MAGHHLVGGRGAVRPVPGRDRHAQGGDGPGGVLRVRTRELARGDAVPDGLLDHRLLAVALTDVMGPDVGRPAPHLSGRHDILVSTFTEKAALELYHVLEARYVYLTDAINGAACVLDHLSS